MDYIPDSCRIRRRRAFFGILWVLLAMLTSAVTCSEVEKKVKESEMDPYWRQDEIDVLVDDGATLIAQEATTTAQAEILKAAVETGEELDRLTLPASGTLTVYCDDHGLASEFTTEKCPIEHYLKYQIFIDFGKGFFRFDTWGGCTRSFQDPFLGQYYMEERSFLLEGGGDVYPDGWLVGNIRMRDSYTTKAVEFEDEDVKTYASVHDVVGRPNNDLTMIEFGFTHEGKSIDIDTIRACDFKTLEDLWQNDYLYRSIKCFLVAD